MNLNQSRDTLNLTTELDEIRGMLLELRASLRKLETRDNIPRRFLTIRNAGKFADLSEETIRRLLASQKLTAHRPVRGRILIDRLELESLIKESVTNPRKGRGRSLG